MLISFGEKKMHHTIAITKSFVSKVGKFLVTNVLPVMRNKFYM